MYTKAAYVIVDILAVAVILIVMKATRRIKEDYGKWLKNTFIAGVIAILANIMIAVSFDDLFAEISYCIYFASIDWIIYFLTGFCLSYTEHRKHLKNMAPVAAVVMGIDSVLILSNLFYKMHFFLYETTGPNGSVFYQTGFKPFYYVHLAVDYVAVIFAFCFLVSGIVRSYSLYRIKYVIILSVLILVIIMNVIYMAFSMLLDASVIFYAVAGTLIYLSITIFVPKNLLISSIGRAVDDMNEGLIIFDMNDNCIYANAFARNRFGIKTEEFYLTSEPIATVLLKLEEKGEKYGATDHVMERTADGIKTTENYRIKYNNLTDKKSRSIGSFFLIEDTTEAEFYLRQINEARENADKANQAKSTFLANMSHEIRTPLNSVLGMNEMITRSTEDPQIREYSQNIKDSGDTLLGLINDILDFSKIEANKMDIVPVEYNAHKLLTDCYYYFEQSAAIKDLYINITCDEQLPSVLFGDFTHIRQIVSNILSNGIKYTNEGGVIIAVSMEKTGEDTIMLCFTVSDTGIGIDSEDLDYLFDAFKRVNEQQNATIQGTGLGLAITKELVELMHGTITVESTLGKGTRFTVRIPQTVIDSKPLGPYVRTRLVDDSVYRETFKAPDAEILLVDDVVLNLKVAEALLKKTLVHVDKATGGNEAIEKCNQKKYDVILLDHRMPDPDGVQVYKTISVSGMNTDTPVIMLTANALEGA
ncbi:MAG: response regulator, partial [Lachnospiraceae bacterium]|nr:response regulator [Lachnospiraceae bacterium]